MHVSLKLHWPRNCLTIYLRYMRGSVIDLLCLLLGKQNIRDLYHLNTFEKRTVEQFLRRLRVELIYRRSRTIKSISELEWISASDYLFNTEDGETNVAVRTVLGSVGASSTNINFRHIFCKHSHDRCNIQTYPYLHGLGSRPLSLWNCLMSFLVNFIEDWPQTSSSKE